MHARTMNGCHYTLVRILNLQEQLWSVHILLKLAEVPACLARLQVKCWGLLCSPLGLLPRYRSLLLGPLSFLMHRAM